MISSEAESDRFKVPAILPDDLVPAFLLSVLRTTTTISPEQKLQQILLQLIVAPIYILPLVVPHYTIVVIIASLVPSLLVLVLDLLFGEVTPHRYLAYGVLGLLWSNHLYSSKESVALVVLSIVSICTSSRTLLHPFREFSSNSYEFKAPQLNSTLYMRLYIAVPTLFPQLVLYLCNWEVPYELQLASSLIFITWTLGWLTTLGNSALFLLNKVNMVIMGDEAADTLQRAVLVVLLNVVPILIYSLVAQSVIVLIVGATVTCIITVLSFLPMRSTLFSFTVLLVKALGECAICAGLCLLYKYVDLSSVAIPLFAADIALFCIVRLLIALQPTFSSLSHHHFQWLLRLILRITSAVCIVAATQLSILPYFSRSQLITSGVIPILYFRSFKRSLGVATSYSLHCSILLGLILAPNPLPILMMVPFPPSFFAVFSSIFLIPDKAIHFRERWLQLGYFLANIIGVSLHLASLGMLQFSMVFGLPVYFPVIPNENPISAQSNAGQLLYQKMLGDIGYSAFKALECGMYLVRFDKQILLCEVKSEGYGLCSLVQFKGLETQDTTSCHAKQARTIDSIITDTWEHQQLLSQLGGNLTVLNPSKELQASIAIQFELNLKGRDTDPDFLLLIRSTLLKAIIWEYNKLQLSEEQLKQANEMLSFLPNDLKNYMKDFPVEFAKQLDFKAVYPTTRLLPPIQKVRPRVLDEYLDLIDPQVTTTNLAPPIVPLLPSSKPSMEEINMTVVLMLYHSVAKRINDTETWFKIISRDKQISNRVQFDGQEEILSRAMAAALHISNMEFDIGQDIKVEQFTAYNADSFLGCADSPSFTDAIKSGKEDVWTVHFQKQKKLFFRKLSRQSVKVRLLRVSEVIVKAVWNNLMFELLFANTNNDERYSIQQHPHLLRNLWVEACEPPFGYPAYSTELRCLT